MFIVTTNPESKYVIEDYSNATGESYYSNMLYSKKNFENLKEEIGLEMLDYTVYREDIALDYIRRNRMLTFLKYRMNLKKPMVKDPDGNVAMILLRKSPKIQL